MTAISPNKMDKKIVCLNPRAILILAATGSVINAETSNIPTIRIDAAMTKAIMTINKK